MRVIIKSIVFSFLIIMSFTNETCERRSEQNNTAKQEQARTEANQSALNSSQPAPRVTWSLERENLIQRFKLQNDRSILMYMYIFNHGIENPIGYYQVNKVSSVNSQLTNPSQLVYEPSSGAGSTDFHELPSPAEDGSYGENGDAIFGFTPDEIYIEHNMQYIVATAPLNFPKTRNIGSINVVDLQKYKKLLDKIQ